MTLPIKSLHVEPIDWINLQTSPNSRSKINLQTVWLSLMIGQFFSS